MEENKCCLCGEKSRAYRSCRFGKYTRQLCPECLGQFRIEEEIKKEHRVVLYDRETFDISHKKAR